MRHGDKTPSSGAFHGLPVNNLVFHPTTSDESVPNLQGMTESSGTSHRLQKLHRDIWLKSTQLGNCGAIPVLGSHVSLLRFSNQQATLAEELERTAVIYADHEIVRDELSLLSLEIADAGSPAILVVDNCLDELHTKLANIACRTGSRLRLVTIDVETKVQSGLVLHLEPASDEMIGSIAHAVAPTLNDSDSRFIQELAKGFPKMAVLAAKRNGIGRQAVNSAEEVLDRIVWGHRQRSDEAQKSLELLSLLNGLDLLVNSREKVNSLQRGLGE